MPTLTRLIIVFFISSTLVYGAMLGLAAWVRPVTTELIIDIPAGRVHLHPWPYAQKKAQSPAEEGQHHTSAAERSQS